MLRKRFLKIIIDLINKYNLPYKYTGNGKFILGGKNPDFVNVNGEKICEEKETFLSKTDDFKILNCYSLIAADDPKQCDKVADDSMKLRNACYYQISRLNNDPSICKNIVIPMIDDVTCEKYLANQGLVATPSLT